jgi:nucleoside-diphosphate-sugar epimerase
MRIVVIGGRGVISWRIAEQALERGGEVLVVHRAGHRHHDNSPEEG